MQIRADRKHAKEQLEDKLKRISDSKTFNATKFRGTVNFKEDGLTFQKRVREEWDERRL